MWLLNTSTFKLEEFYSNVPRYAILSHRWKENEELSFGGLEEPHPQSNRTGYEKIKNFCLEARTRRLAYVWADTCCIDKRSSAELSEAINSMYTFYNRATICYVYLYDVVSLTDFGQSSWFTRGWTLQELLAPSKLHFFNRTWKPIGSRSRLAPQIERITGIPRKALWNFSLAEYCVAEKFSWSAKRSTTRAEDCAYCLLGLFQINMPLLYGEGTRAFQRLQEEIMKTSTDMSIFLWQGPAMDGFGMLASNPSCFSDTPDMVKSVTRTCTTLFSMSEGWTLNNAGISIEAYVYPYLLAADLGCIFALHLHESHQLSRYPGFAIFVKKHDAGRGSYARVTVDGTAWTCSAEESVEYLPFGSYLMKLRLLRQPLEDTSTPNKPCGFSVSLTSDDLVACAAYQRRFGNPDAKLRSWQQVRKTCRGSLDWSFLANPRHATGVHGYLLFTLVDDIQILLCLGLSRDFQPLCVILPFCKSMLDKGLDCARILRQYNRISEGERDRFEIFDTEIHMICMCGDDQVLESGTYIGLTLQILDGFDHPSMLKANIEFDLEKFVQYYVPTADVSGYDCIRFMSRNIFDSLLDVELKIDSMRRDNYFV